MQETFGVRDEMIPENSGFSKKPEFFSMFIEVFFTLDETRLSGPQLIPGDEIPMVTILEPTFGMSCAVFPEAVNVAAFRVSVPQVKTTIAPSRCGCSTGASADRTPRRAPCFDWTPL